jgi:hypothetical protein
VAEQALDDDQRDTFARHLDGEGVAELVRSTGGISGAPFGRRRS